MRGEAAVRFALPVFCVVAVCSTAATAYAQRPPLTLRQAVAEALAASPLLGEPDDGRTLAAIKERQEEARFALKLTPTVQSGSGASGLRQQSLGIDATKRLRTGTSLLFNASRYQFGTSAAELNDAGYSVAISQPLLRGWIGIGSASLVQARRAVASADRNYADARQQLVVSTARAYFSVIREQRLVTAAAAAQESAARLRISSAARAEVGLATELDVLRADLLVSQSEASAVAERERLDAAKDELRTLIGRPTETEVEPAGAGLTELDAVSVDETLEVLIRRALANRLDVSEARDRAADARRIETQARWNLWPPLSLDVSYTKRGLGSSGVDLWAPLYNGWRFGVSTSYTLDRSDETAAAAAATVSTRSAAREAQDVERRVTDEVRRAYRSWRAATSTMEIQRKATVLAERQLRLARIRYETGVAGNFDVVDAENGSLQANAALIAAEIEAALSRVTLARVTGALDPDRFLK